MSDRRPFTLVRRDEVRWEIPRTGNMLVPGLIYADERILPSIQDDRSPEQVYNVAHLPGIVYRSLAMPDIHWGYGFPIGGVAAFDLDHGIVSPGGVGYDINCGVRVALTGLKREVVAAHIRPLIDAIFARVPCGVGSKGDIRLDRREMDAVLRLGAGWAVSSGMGDAADLGRIENHGALPGADPAAVSDRAFERGRDQIGTLGSGNHFLEIGYVDEIFDVETASQWGLELDGVTMMVHSGSRGLGYQVCDEFLARMVKTVGKEGLELPDRQLACTRFTTDLAREYLGAMAAAANFAFANRQVLMHLARRTWEEVLGIPPKDLRFRLLYDVCHNIAKIETHEVNGKKMRLCVHRKGATRAFPAGHPELPPEYRASGQPVLIPGDMGRASYILAGEPGSMRETFGSACHGAGRLLSRGKAMKAAKGRAIERELQAANIYSRSKGVKTLKEEIPEAYKDVNMVVDVVHRAGLARKVARIRPMGVVKG